MANLIGDIDGGFTMVNVSRKTLKEVYEIAVRYNVSIVDFSNEMIRKLIYLRKPLIEKEVKEYIEFLRKEFM